MHFTQAIYKVLHDLLLFGERVVNAVFFPVLLGLGLTNLHFCEPLALDGFIAWKDPSLVFILANESRVSGKAGGVAGVFAGGRF